MALQRQKMQLPRNQNESNVKLKTRDDDEPTLRDEKHLSNTAGGKVSSHYRDEEEASNNKELN